MVLSPVNLQHSNYNQGQVNGGGHSQSTMTSSTSLKVWFVCKMCRTSLSNIDSFIEHKIQNHKLTKFENIRSIVFEEKAVYIDDDDQDVSIKLENIKFLSLEMGGIIPWESELTERVNENSPSHHNDTENGPFEVEQQHHLSAPDVESDPNRSKINESGAYPSFQIRTNPFVVLKRLTSSEIQAATPTSVSDIATNNTNSMVEENPNDQIEKTIEAINNGNNSCNSDFALEEISPITSTFPDALSESEFNFDPDADEPFIIEPKIEITVLDDDIDVDLNVNGAAWGESGASTSTTENEPGSDAAYEEFLVRYSPFVPLKRLTPEVIEDAAAGKLNLLSNSVPLLGRQLLLAERNQDDEDDEMEFNGEADASLLNSDGTGSRFLDDCYEVNLNEKGHIIFKPNNVDHQNVDPPLDETSIVCTLCKFVTDSKVILKNHMRIHSKALMCLHVDCFASFDFRPSLQRHYGVYHSPLKPFRCSYDDCYEAYQCPQNLKVHFMDHTGERPFRCTHEQCPSEFKTEKALFLHTSRNHPNERPFKCPRKGCSKAFSIEAFLNAHLRKHTATGDRRCPNPRCRRSFRTPGYLSVHLRFCNNTAASKRFPCPHDGCHKVYRQSISLKLHFMDHSGERPFLCTHENCTKAFKDKYQLASHTSFKHSDAELPVKCPRKGCSKGFNSTGLDYVSHLSGCRFAVKTHKKLPQPPAANSIL